jgi:hypothetical protein
MVFTARLKIRVLRDAAARAKGEGKAAPNAGSHSPSTHSETVCDLCAVRAAWIARRYPLAAPTAHAVAMLHFGGAADA